MHLEVIIHCFLFEDSKGLKDIQGIQGIQGIHFIQGIQINEEVSRDVVAS